MVGKKSSANGSRKSSGFSPDRKTSSRAATTRLGSKDCHYVTSCSKGVVIWFQVAETFWRILQPETSSSIHSLTVAYSMCFGCYCLFMSVPIFDSSFSWPFSLPCFLQFQAQAKHPIRNIQTIRVTYHFTEGLRQCFGRFCPFSTTVASLVSRTRVPAETSSRFITRYHNSHNAG